MWECANCGENVEADFNVCWNCQTEKGSLSTESYFALPKSQRSIEEAGTEGKIAAAETRKESSTQTVANQAPAIMKRYKDAYIVAKVTNGFGGLIKAIGIIIGGLLVVGGFIVASNGGPRDPMSALAIVGIVVGVIAGALFYIIGVLVSAQAQILKASLDSAVNTSPFLTNEHRAQIMSLPRT